jgi:hypothetical protein
LSWWRRVKISASSEDLDRNNPMTAHQISLRMSPIGASIARFAAIRQLDRVYGSDRQHPPSGQSGQGEDGTGSHALPVDVLRLDFDRRLMLQFRGSVVTSDASLLAYRELEGALRLTVMAGEMLADARTGNNGGSRIARPVHINGNAVAPMRAATAIMSGSLCLK